MKTNGTNHKVLAIKRVAAKVCGVTMRALNSRARDAKTAFARQIAMALCHDLLTEVHPYKNGKTIPLSYTAIAHQFDRGCHGTVEWAVWRVRQADATDSDGSPLNPDENELINSARDKVHEVLKLLQR